MEKQFCNTHTEEEQKYFCSHSTCIKAEDNTLLCLECFTQHKKGRSKFHKKISILAIKETAKQKLEQYLKLQDSNIQKCEVYSQKCSQNLSELFKQLNVWIEEQQKMITNSKEAQISILKKNIEQAKEHYKVNNLDNLLYFFKINLEDEIEISEEFQNLTERSLNYQLKEINAKAQVLTSKSCNLQNIFSAKIINLQIQLDQLKDLKYGKCELHQAKKMYICTQQNSIQKDTASLSCLGCLEKNHEHKCENKECIKKITTIQEEQNLKRQKMKDESKVFQSKLQSCVDEQLEIFSALRQKNIDFYESQKEQLLSLENETLNKLKQNQEIQYTLGNIDFSLLFQTNDLIKQQYLLEFQGVLKKIKIIEEQKPNIQSQFLAVDQETKQLKDYNTQMKQQIELLNKQLIQQEAKLKDQSLNAIYEAVTSIQKKLDAK